MRESKLINQLKGLDKKELKGLKVFLRSPYFNNSEDVIKLFEVVSKHAPNYDPLRLKKEKVFEKIYSGKPFKDVKLRNLMSKLSRLIERYLIQLYYEEKDFEKEKLLAKIYGKRSSYILFENIINKLLKEIKNQSTLTLGTYKEIHELGIMLYEHKQTNSINHSMLLQNAIEALEQYFITERLRLVLGLKTREKLLSELYPLIVDDFDYLNNKTNLIHTLYGKAFGLLEHPSNENYQRLKESFFEDTSVLSKKTAIIPLRLALNYLILRINKNESTYTEECLQWYRIGIEKEWLMENGIILYADFLNVIIFASKKKNFDWATSFLDSYSQKLPATNQKDAVALASGFISFFQSKYTQVIEQLIYFKFLSFGDQILAKTLLIRSYFKLIKIDDSYYYSLISSCKAFENYIRRHNVINDIKKESYLNFISIIRRLIQFEHKDYLTKKKLLHQLNAYPNVFARTWLEEEICLLK